VDVDIPVVSSPAVQDTKQLDVPAAASSSTTKDYGCVWDGPNYSCAFDSTFMVAFSMYRYASLPWRQQWRGSSDFNGMLAGFFDNILVTVRMPLLHRQLPSLFNGYRDRVRDHLNAIDPTCFPRFGQNNVAASEIFVQMCRFEGNRRPVHLKFTCDNGTHQPVTKTYTTTFILMTHEAPPAEHSFSGKPTIQLWLSDYFRQIEDDPPQCQTCHTPCSPSSLSFTPLPWIWFDIPQGHDQRFALSTALTIRQYPGPDVSYTLTGIIYAGGAHFSARWKDASGKWWAHDGMVNSGQPVLDTVADDAELTKFGPRAMHILIYRLYPASITRSP
jgi:hypothetical protein